MAEMGGGSHREGIGLQLGHGEGVMMSLLPQKQFCHPRYVFLAGVPHPHLTVRQICVMGILVSWLRRWTGLLSAGH